MGVHFGCAQLFLLIAALTRSFATAFGLAFLLAVLLALATALAALATATRIRCFPFAWLGAVGLALGGFGPFPLQALVGFAQLARPEAEDQAGQQQDAADQHVGGPAGLDVLE